MPHRDVARRKPARGEAHFQLPLVHRPVLPLRAIEAVPRDRRVGGGGGGAALDRNELLKQVASSPLTSADPWRASFVLTSAKMEASSAPGDMSALPRREKDGDVSAAAAPEVGAASEDLGQLGAFCRRGCGGGGGGRGGRSGRGGGAAEGVGESDVQRGARAAVAAVDTSRIGALQVGAGEVAEAEHDDAVARDAERGHVGPVAAVVDQRRRRRREREDHADRQLPAHHRRRLVGAEAPPRQQPPPVRGAAAGGAVARDLQHGERVVLRAQAGGDGDAGRREARAEG